MKIIERGHLPEQKPYRVTCGTCRTIFEFEQREAKVTRDQRDGDYVSIACPVCQTKCTHAL
jgi:RNase P subunit RPR2